MLADYHVHTTYSTDGSSSMESMVKEAIEKGIEEICFTDHVDYGIKRDWDDPLGLELFEESILLANVDYPRYFVEIDALQRKYQYQIKIKKGLELGVQMHTIDLFKDLIKRYPTDFLLLSVHQVNDLEFWNQQYQNGRTQDEYNLGYYQEIYDVMRNFNEYSVLAHLDHIVRYDNNGVYPFEKIKPIITDILKLAIENGKGIEVNTSSIRYQLSDTTPSKDILMLYKQLGGKIITIGSDAHSTQHLGLALQQTKKYLKSLGFDSFCTFSNMKPIFHSLDD